MPELPEVETVVRDLRPHLVGRRIASVKVGRHKLRQRWQPKWAPRLLGRCIGEIRRRGKWILCRLNDEQHLVIHLGMTGQLVATSEQQPIASHTHAIFGLDGGAQQLRFRDIRRFGGITLFEDEAKLELFFQQAELGPEPFDLDRDYWRQSLARTSRCLKAVLLDQRVVAGVGNIYADESLFQARLHPVQLGRSTSPTEADRLSRAIVAVLKRAIERRGSSIRDYVGGSGLQGEYQREFRVYGQTGEPCPHCGKAIKRIRLAGRSTHFCPSCQRKR